MEGLIIFPRRSKMDDYGRGHRSGNGNGQRRRDGSCQVVSVWDFFDAISRDFDEVFNGIENFHNIMPATFPPTNFYIDDDKNLKFEFALAGYVRDEIELSFDGDKMFLTLTPIRKEEDEHIKSLSKGIKHSSAKSYYVVPAVKYDQSAATADYENGILTVFIPSREEAKPKKTTINIK